MPYIVKQRGVNSSHEWAVLNATCKLDDDNDLLLLKIVDLVRESYGENSLLIDAEVLFSEDISNNSFSLEHLRAAFREGLPDPIKEGNKPSQLTNYRSQTSEMVAKSALEFVYNYSYPASPQAGSGNPNQPILGFDGWGLYKGVDNIDHLVLIQVKATDVSVSPPPDALKLANECINAPKDKSAICRALSVMSNLMIGDPLRVSIMKFLEKIGRNEEIPIIVSPAIVRGSTDSNYSDIEPVFHVAEQIMPATIRAIVISIGVCLEDFGVRVMSKSRETT